MRLAHYTVRVRDLEASISFYEAVLGLRAGPRPPFGFPGAWLYGPDDDGSEDGAPDRQGLVHLIGAFGDGAGLAAYLGDRTTAQGSGAVDHIAFTASNWPAQRARCEAVAAPFTERTVPDLGLRQVFIVDPSGVTIELNYWSD